MPRVPHDRFDCAPGCPVEGTLSLIGGKWKGVILYHLTRGTLRFNEIRRVLPKVTQRMLTNQLRELEADGLVVRRIYAEVPPRVEYSLSTRGRTPGAGDRGAGMLGPAEPGRTNMHVDCRKRASARSRCLRK